MTAALEYNSSLEELDLSSNDIDRESGGFIAQVLRKPSTTLRWLDLSNTPLDELGAKHLATGIALNTTLVTLCVSGCNILDQGKNVRAPSDHFLPHSGPVPLRKYRRLAMPCPGHRRSPPLR